MASSQSAVELLPLGAIIKTFQVGGRNIVLGFNTPAQYQEHNVPYFGETIGRVANRIKEGKIKSLNGKSYNLAVNNGPNHLHGGNEGWGKRIWKGPTPIGIRAIPGLPGSKLEGGESVRFTLRSEDGDEGYPGAVEATVVYTTGTQKTDDGKEVVVLAMEYEAQIVDDTEETVINMTNHSYFNLSDNPTIEGTEVELCSSTHLPLDTGIPKGETASFPGIVPNKPFTLGATEPVIDDNFITNPSATSILLDTREEPLTVLVKAFHPSTGVHLNVSSTEPSFQFYTGGYTDVPAVNGLPARGPRAGFCVEPSRYVNAVNDERWRSQVILKKGQKYGARSVYQAWIN